jgi:hypothetical protein
MRTNINRLVILPTALQLGSYILLGLSIDHQHIELITWQHVLDKENQQYYLVNP